MCRTAGAAGCATGRACAELVDSAGGGGLSGAAWYVFHRRRHFRQRSRQCPPLRHSAAAEAFLGLVPSERSTGDTVKRGGLTLAGNRRARRGLIEGAWAYRYPARVTEPIREGADAALRPLPAPDGCGQEQTHRRCGDRARGGGVPVGHRPPGQTGALRCGALLHRRSRSRQERPRRGRRRIEASARAGSLGGKTGQHGDGMWPRWGTPVLIMWPGISPTPATRQGWPRTDYESQPSSQGPCRSVLPSLRCREPLHGRGGPYIFCGGILQDRIVEHLLREQLLEPRVLSSAFSHSEFFTNDAL